MKINKSKLLKTTAGFLVIIFILLAGVFYFSCQQIKNGVAKHCYEAQRNYGGDCVEALIKTVDDDNNSLRTRNFAIWSLGQLGDKRALSVLEKYYTGNIPDKELYDKSISQYELKKALKLVNGGLNITHFVWQPDNIVR